MPIVDKVLADLNDCLPFVVVEEDLKDMPLATDLIALEDEKIIRKRKVRAKKDSKQYEIEIIETEKPGDIPDEARVIVITTEVSGDTIDGPAPSTTEAPKKSVRKVKKEKLKEFIVNIVEEAPLDHVSEIYEDVPRTLSEKARRKRISLHSQLRWLRTK